MNTASERLESGRAGHTFVQDHDYPVVGKGEREKERGIRYLVTEREKDKERERI
jgi:hypothetical protein